MADLSADSWSALTLQFLVFWKDTVRNFCLTSKTRKDFQFSYIFLLYEPRKTRKRREIKKFLATKEKCVFY